jgi:hypothetical protein
MGNCCEKEIGIVNPYGHDGFNIQKKVPLPGTKNGKMVGINLDQTLSRKGRPSVSLKDHSDCWPADLRLFN